MGRPSKYSPEVRERAVRMVFDHAPEHPSQWAAIRSVAEKLGCTTEIVAPMGAPGGARCRPAAGPDDRRARSELKATPARNRRTEARQRDSAEGVGVFRPGGARPPSEVMVTFIDQHRDAYGVEPICARPADRPVHVFPAEGAAAGMRRSGRRARSRRRAADGDHSAGLGRARPGLRRRGKCGGRCGARASAWPAARVRRLMRDMGVRGVVRGRAWTTTTPAGRRQPTGRPISSIASSPRRGRISSGSRTSVCRSKRRRR